MNTLEKITTDLDRVEKTATINLDDIPQATRGSWGNAQREAKEQLNALKSSYRDALFGNAVAILMNGDPGKIDEYVKLVRDGGEGLSVDANALYDRLAKSVEETVGGSRQWGVTQTQRLHLALQGVLHEVGLTEMPMPAKDSMPFVATYGDVLAHVRQIVRDAVGDSLNRVYIENAVIKQAREIRYIGVMVPVLVTNARSDEADNLTRSFAKGNTFVNLNTEDVIDKEFLVKSFKDINKKIRKK
jgi:hypothetical protein